MREWWERVAREDKETVGLVIWGVVLWLLWVVSR